ncbi:uncharacterized protein [Rutidosis leptorrhynchoides]|uniref:uncharacterized protein n=1 Tax=Rutidosis leptorrhynchoides TaxID=125765 RepID=UPI003A990438
MELMNNNNNNTLRNDDNNFKFPFTSTQWQELEHQALVYKYMISGIPIPNDLLSSIKTSLYSSTKLIMHHQSPHQSIGWKCFQMGFGKKIDPEPGRCRRTDGKKWRCSKEAYPDSKYCERHMHRGRNRSRKPVEITPPPLSTMSTKSLNYPSPSNSHSPYVSPNHHKLSSSSSSSSARCHDNVLSCQDGFWLESSPYSEKDHSYRMKEDVDEHLFLSESGGGDSWRLDSLVMNSSASLAQSKQQTLLDHQNDYSYLQLQNTSRQRQMQDLGRCYDQLGFKIDIKDEPQKKVMHHFFDESPHNDNDDRNKDNDSSKTQLSISFPSYAHDFFLSHNDK